MVWLDSDPQRAAVKYEEIRHKLIKIFVCRGCTSAEELADKTINRVTQKLPEIVDTYVGDPGKYFSGVAKNILHEYEKEKHVVTILATELPDCTEEDDENLELEHDCLDQCLQRLTPEAHELILDYYRGDKQSKIDNRRSLAQRLGLKLNALRTRADRIRSKLEECVNECVERTRNNV
jgi:DNA-directed RNA polymerase specialized sigma24 family protein